MKTCRWSLGICLALILGIVRIGQAYQQLTPPVAFDLDTAGIMHVTSTLTLIMGTPDPATQPSISFALDAGGTEPLTLLPEQIAGIVVFKNTTFADVQTGMLGDVQWQTGAAVAIDINDIVVLRTADNLYIKLSVTNVSGNAVNFAYQQMPAEPAHPAAASSVPEPGTLALVGIGLSMIVGCLRKQRILSVLVLGVLVVTASGSAAEPMQVGETVAAVFETAHPYPGGMGVIWEKTLQRANASYIKIHFANFDLAAGDYVTVADPSGTHVYQYDGKGKVVRGGAAVLSAFWASYIPGDTAIVRLYSTHEQAQGKWGIKIDQWAHGYEAGKMGNMPSDLREAICGSDNKQWAQCSNPSTEYTKAKTVVRLLIGGDSACTGWLLGSDGHLMTNNHCIATQAAADNTEYEFMAERTCGTDCSGWFACPGTIVATSGTLVKTSSTNGGLDYTLIQLPTNESSTYGYLTFRSVLPAISENIYIPQHPAGKGKQIAAYDDQLGGNCQIRSLSEAACSGTTTYKDIGYTCDTEGGSSGSPVLSKNDNLVVGLHHCGGCNNTAVPIPNIIKDLGIKMPNDGAMINCDAAIPLAPGILYSGTTVGALNVTPKYSGASGETGATGPEKIHKIYLPKPGVITVALSGITVDFDIFILNACSQYAVAAANTSGSLLPADNTITYNATAGTYYVVVDGYNGKSGSYKLNVSYPSGYDNWSQWVNTQKTIGSNVAMATYSGRLYQSLKGTDLYLWNRSTTDGVSWYLWQQVINGSTPIKTASTHIAMQTYSGDGLLYQAVREYGTNKVLTTATNGSGWWIQNSDDSGYKAGDDITMTEWSGNGVLYQSTRALATTAPAAAANLILTRTYNGMTWTWTPDPNGKKAASRVTMEFVPSSLCQATTEYGTYKVMTRTFNGSSWSNWTVDAKKATGNIAMVRAFATLYQTIREMSTNKVWTRSSSDGGNTWTVWVEGGIIAASDVMMKAATLQSEQRLYQTVLSGGKVYTRYTKDGVNWTAWIADTGTMSSAVSMEIFNPSDGYGNRLYQAGKGASNTGWWRMTTGVPLMTPQREMATPPPVTIRKAGAGTGTIAFDVQVCGPECVELQIPYTEGAQVQLTVTPTADSYFVRWEKVDGTVIANISTVLPGETVIAVFQKK